MSAVASLGMYDAPGARAANDAFWGHVVRRLRAVGFDDVPERLDRQRPLGDVWTDPDLLLAQTCGYPLTTSLQGRVQLVCTPVYEAVGCDGPMHRAAVVVRAEDPALSLLDLRGRRCAVNDFSSNTGHNLLRRMIAEVAEGAHFLVKPAMVTGSHVASLEAISSGRADFATIDCVTLAHVQRDRTDLASSVRILRWTDPTPGLPLITSLATSPERLLALRHALRLALRALEAPLRDATLIRSFANVRATRYREIALIEQQAVELGYPVLR